MTTLLALVLFALAGLLAGGAWSLHRQGAGLGVVVLVALLSALALAGGVAWLWPQV
ncbi:MAG TPA: hypothetical protein VKY81_04870 [Natronosporangium sp.]|nr:hypothetical protein [Natronosporangium sp.]